MDNLPSLIESRAPRRDMPRDERDFILLSAFVLVQHGHIDRAGVLLESLYALGEYPREALVGRAILRFYKQDWRGALNCLEELDRFDPLERFGAYILTDRQRLRRYLKARCLFELGERESAREATEVYLRNRPTGASPSRKL